MFETIKNDLEDVLEESKSSIRKVISSFSEKVSTCKESDLHKIVNMANNAILPNIYNFGISTMKKTASDSIMNLKEEIEVKSSTEFIASVKSYVKKWLEESHSFRQELIKEKGILASKEKAAVQKIDIIYQKFVSLEEKPSWYSFIFSLFGSNASKMRTISLARKLLQTQGGLTYIRLKLRELIFLINTYAQIEDFLRTKISSKLDFLEGKISEVLKITETELNTINNNILPDKGYQVDIQTKNKLSTMSERVDSRISISLAKEIFGELDKASAEEILNKLKGKLSKIYEDFRNYGALERINEIYSDREDMGVFLQSLMEREGSPFIALNDLLLDKSPLFVTTVGIADESNNRIGSALESRISRGSNSVGIQNDPEKVISLVTAHRIPIYAIAGFNNYLNAVKIKESEREFAVYPERRFTKYLSPYPSESEVRLDNFLALGLAEGIIKNYSNSWYQVNGKKVHGINNLRKILASDTKTLNLIRNNWLDTYSQEGLSGIIAKLNSAKEVLTFNGLADVLDKLEKRLSSLKEDETSKERISQILEG